MDWEISPWAKAHLGNVHSNLPGTAFGPLFPLKLLFLLPDAFRSTPSEHQNFKADS